MIRDSRRGLGAVLYFVLFLERLKPRFDTRPIGRGLCVLVDAEMAESQASVMEIDLTPEQKSFVHLGIEQGRFKDSADAVNHAMELWVERERSRLELLAAIDAGDASLEQDDIVLDSDEDLAEFMKGIEERGRARLAAH